MRILISGTSQVEAAELIGISPARISQLVNSELFAGEMARMQKEIGDKFVENEASVITECKKKLLQMSVDAVGKISSLMKGAESEQVQAKMAESVLDRIGLKAIDRVEASVSVSAPEGLKDALALALAEQRKPKGEVS
jgi:predicted transcriptional regulator